jgi:hypothetical protein
MAAADERGVPVEAIAGLALGGLGPQALDLAAPEMHAVDVALLGLGIHDVLVLGVEHAVEAVAAADVDPVGVEDAFLGEGAAGPHPVEVVLQAAADAIGRALVDGDPVELAGRHPRQVFPALASVDATIGAAVGAQQQPFGVAGVDGQGVKVGVDLGEAVLAEAASTVFGDVQSVAEEIDLLVARTVERPHRGGRKSTCALC